MICNECARWRAGVEDANRISQRFEAENVKLKAALNSLLVGIRWEEELCAWVLTNGEILRAAVALLPGREG